MKHILLSVLCFVSLALAADEPLIPTSLNAVLPRIKPGMTAAEVKEVIQTAYPKVEMSTGPWSGMTGHVVYRLDARFRVGFTANLPPSGGPPSGGRAIIRNDYLTCIWDEQQPGHRLEISHYPPGRSSDTKPSP